MKMLWFVACRHDLLIECLEANERAIESRDGAPERTRCAKDEPATQYLAPEVHAGFGDQVVVRGRVNTLPPRSRHPHRYQR